MDLSVVKNREALKAQREPYWQRLSPGRFLGYRPSKLGGNGTWIARIYDEERQAYALKSLGTYADRPGRDRFAAAKADAEAWAVKVVAGAKEQTKIETVGDACREYGKLKPEAVGRFARHVDNDPIARVKLDRLRRSHLKDWRARLEAKPALVSRRKKGEPVVRRRAASSVNRDMAILRAALNKVLERGRPGTEAAWQEALKAVPNADGRRTLYLDRRQRQKLLAALPTAAQAFVRALCLLPLRPGAVAALKAGDFDKRTGELTISRDKAGEGRRIVLPPQARKLFGTCTKDKLPGAFIFTRDNGAQWTRHTWNEPISEVLTSAGLPAGTTAYVLRHSTITDLVTAGLPLLTVAQISGTSAEMIERHYGHLARNAATAALAGLAL